jgi:hypothetical protein
MEKVKYCKWCGKRTNMGQVVVSETPILEFLENKIDEHDREAIWGEECDLSEQHIDSDFEAELLIYDELLNTLTPKTICSNCLKSDEHLWKKYYPDSLEE